MSFELHLFMGKSHVQTEFLMIQVSEMMPLYGGKIGRIRFGGLRCAGSEISLHEGRKNL